MSTQSVGFFGGEPIEPDEDSSPIDFGNLQPANETRLGMDPLRRLRMSLLARWAFVAAIVLCFLALPFAVHSWGGLSTQEEQRTQQVKKAFNKLLRKHRGPGAQDSPEARAKRADLWARAEHETSKPLPLRVWDFTNQAAVSILTCAVVLLLCRLIPNAFPPWRDATEFGRDLLYASLIYGVVQFGGVLVFVDLFHAVEPARSLPTIPWYLVNRAWIGYSGLVLALLWLQWSGRTRSGTRPFASQVAVSILVPLLPVAVTCLLMSLSPNASGYYWALSRSQPWVGALLGLGALVTGTVFVGVWVRAVSIENGIRQLQREARQGLSRGGGGVRSANAPMELTVTVIGNAKSGKSTLLAGAHREWTKKDTASLVIASPTHLDDPDRSKRDWEEICAYRARQTLEMSPLRPDTEAAFRELREIEQRLYDGVDSEGEPVDAYDRFPNGTMRLSEIPFDFDLRLNKRRRVCLRLHCHDYPGGIFDLMAEYDNMKENAREFYERMKYTDALVMIVDMSFLRCGDEAKTLNALQKIHVAAMESLANQNVHHRVIPVAVVLTKCDEIFIEDAGAVVDDDVVQKLLRRGNFDELENKWRSLMEQCGGQFEFEVFATSAVVETVPDQRGMEFPFVLPEQSIVRPQGCAAPFFWIAARSMHWNTTLLGEIKSWLTGMSADVVAPLEAARRLETMVHNRPWILERRSRNITFPRFGGD